MTKIYTTKQLITLAAVSVLFSCSTYDTEPESAVERKGLVINEVLSVNGSGVLDEFGERSDWIELYNNSDKPVSLDDYYLSNSRDLPLMWHCGAGEIGPGEYLLVYASGKDISTPETPRDPLKVKIDWAGGWSDGAGQGKGNSFVEPWAFDNIFDYQTGGVSGLLYMGNNSGVLAWTGDAIISMLTGSLSSKNLEKYNQMEIFGYIENDRTFKFSFEQKSWEKMGELGITLQGLRCYVTGKGESTDKYTLQLNSSSYDPILNYEDITKINLSFNQIEDSARVRIDSIRFSQSNTAKHTSFPISSQGERLFLTNISGTTVDSVTVPELDADRSWGRRGDGDNFVYYNEPTPGRSNDSGEYIEVAGSVVRTTTPSGFYPNPVSVQLVSQSGDEIYYTFDGSVPTTKSQKYDKPFQVTKSQSVRFAPFRNGVMIGDVQSCSYIIDDFPDVPVVSIHVDSLDMFDSLTGIHSLGEKYWEKKPNYGANFWDKEMELPATIEYFEASGNRAFELDLGFSIFGGFSRAAVKKSFGLMCRKEYSQEKFNYPFFKSHPELRQFSSLILRSGSQHQTAFSGFDSYRSSLTNGMGIPYQKAQPVVIYINGEYWGLYYLREKLNENFFETNYGIPSENINLVKEAGNIQSGSINSYIDLISYIKERIDINSEEYDINSEESYDYINSQMDIHQYSNYYSAEIYLTNTDWPANNMKWWRDRSPEGRWKWAMYDTDADTVVSFNMIDYIMNPAVDTATYPNGKNFSYIFHSLLENDRFKADFINRMAALLNTQFAPERARAMLDKAVQETKSLWQADFERWDFNSEDRSLELSNMEDFAANRPDYVRQHMIDQFDLGGLATMRLGTERGNILVNGLSIGDNNRGEWFTGSDITLSLTDSTGFSQWSDGHKSATRRVTPEEGVSLTAQF